jgi:hypothetical protein
MGGQSIWGHKHAQMFHFCHYPLNWLAFKVNQILVYTAHKKDRCYTAHSALAKHTTPSPPTVCTTQMHDET